MMLEKKTKIPMIKDVIMPTNGFFNHINFQFPSFLTKSQLDIAFFSDYSMRNIAPIVQYYLNSDTLSNESLDSIGEVILQMFGKKWEKQAAVYNIEYDPISNYRDEYHETNNVKHTGTVTGEWGDERNTTRTDDLTETQNKGTTVTNTRTDNLVQTDTRNLTDTLEENVNNNVYGFNSSDNVPDSSNTDNYTKKGIGDTTRNNTGTQKNEVTGSGADTITNTGTQKNDSKGSGSKTDTTDLTDDGKRDYEHIGNIGNHTTQHLISQEIELWSWNYMQEIIKDVARCVTLPTYIG